MTIKRSSALRVSRNFIWLFAKIVIGLTFILSLWIVLANLITPFSTGQSGGLLLTRGQAVLLFGLVLFAIVLIAIWHKFAKLRNFIHDHRTLFVAIAIGLVSLVGFLARMALVAQPNVPLSNDPAMYFSEAQSVAQNGKLVSGSSGTALVLSPPVNDRQYYALFPYLTSYTTMLAGAMKISGTSYTTAIILNLLFDAAGAVIFYRLIKRLTKSQNWALVGFGLWVLSPFEICFSVLSLPVVVVNFAVVLALWLILLMLESRHDSRKFFLLTLAIGLTLGFANILRPIFTVVVILLLILYLAILLREKNRWKVKFAKILFSFLLVLVPFFALNIGQNLITENLTGYKDVNSRAGWSVFVGANFATNGEFNWPDANIISVATKATNPAAAQRQMLADGLARYQHMAPLDFAKLLVKKSIVFSGNQGTAAYQKNGVASWLHNPHIGSLIIDASTWYLVALLVFAGVFLAQFFRRLSRKFIWSPSRIFLVFATAWFLVLYCAMLLVEAMNRYFQPFLPLVMLFAILGAAGLTAKFREKSAKILER